MDKIDARKLSPDALKALRGQALRMREELKLSWREIARVMGVHVTTVLAWAQRYAHIVIHKYFCFKNNKLGISCSGFI